MKAIFVALLRFIVVLGTATAGNSDNKTKSVQDCIAECPFSMLEGAMYEEDNRLNLWTTFHHPRGALPHYLVVRYSANVTSDDEYYNTTETYLWTSNSVYFIIPPHVFGFISLFMGMLDEDHTGEVSLTLPEECSCWLNGSLYYTDRENSKMNYLEILTDKLRGIATVSGTPQSVSHYQYLSSAVRKDKLSKVYHKHTNVFFSFIFMLPFLAITAYAIIIFSKHEAIKEQMMKPERHQDFAALIGLGLTLAWYTTILDIFAVAWFTHKDHTSGHIYFSKENHENNPLKYTLIISLVVELIICCEGEIWLGILTFREFCGDVPCRKDPNNPRNVEKSDDKTNRINVKSDYEPIPGSIDKSDDKNGNVESNHKYWWILLFFFIPPIWCLPSHFGFILIAWSSFVRHSKSLTLFYVLAITVMYLVMRQSYKLIIDKYCYHSSKTTSRKEKQERDEKKERAEKQERDGISVWVIQLVRLVGVLLVGFFIYLTFGLWLLPVTELVEESPIHLYDSLQLMIVLLAILVSYGLISFREEKIEKLLEDKSSNEEKIVKLLEDKSSNEKKIVKLLKDKSSNEEKIVKLLRGKSSNEEKIVKLFEKIVRNQRYKFRWHK